jgi:hypothetical protein
MYGDIRDDLEDDEQKTRKAARNAALSGLVGGGVMAGAGKALSGERNLATILRRAAIGGGGAGALAGLGTYAGSKILGAPGEDEPSGYTRRGALGGSVGGGLLGGGLGYLIGAGGGRKLAKAFGGSPIAKRAAAVAHEELPLDNLLTDQLKHWAERPSHRAGLKAGGLLGGVLGLTGGAMASSEGMEQDFLENEIRDAKKKRMREAMLESY